MTTRKPPGVSFSSWIERQIRSAEAEGAFENLSGAGKPIADIDRPRGDLDWLANYLRREEVEVVGLLPPALALAKEVEDLPMRLLRERSEYRVRTIVEDLNDRIRQAQLAPQDGPPFRVRTVKVDAALEQWRAARAEAAALAPAPEPVRAAPDPANRRRWLWRRTRRAAGDEPLPSEPDSEQRHR
jgi:hypothetical protein